MAQFVKFVWNSKCSIAGNGFALCDSALAFRQSALFTEVPKGLPIAKREAVYEKPRGIFVNGMRVGEGFFTD